jgi:hypothetical protein
MTEALTEFERAYARTLGYSRGAHGERIAEGADFLAQFGRVMSVSPHLTGSIRCSYGVPGHIT